MKKILLIVSLFISAFSYSQNVHLGVSTTNPGMVPAIPNDPTKFFNGAGAYAVPAGFISTYNVKLAPYSAAGDGIEIQNAGSGSTTTFTSSVATFHSTDVGKIIVIDGAGTAGRQLVTTISGFTNSTTITLTNTIITTVSGVRFIYGTDCTTQIQAAINACAAAGGGQVYFPIGLYMLGGPLQNGVNGVNYNSQLYIPSGSSSRDTSAASAIQLVGEGSPNYIGNDVFNATPYFPSKKGTVLLSTISGSGVAAAVIGSRGPATAFDSLNYTNLIITNLTILVPINQTGNGPTIGGINASHSANFYGENLMISVDNSVWNEPIPTADCAGLLMPMVNAETMNVLKTTFTIGFHYGVIPGEHSSLDQVQAGACYEAFPNQRLFHPWYGARIAAFWCRKVLSAPQATFCGLPSGGSNFSISQLDVEQITLGSFNPTSWQDTTTIISDPGNLISANILSYQIVEGGVGPGSAVTKVGGAGVHYTQDITKMNQQEIIGGPSTTLSSSNGVTAIDSTAKLEINSQISTSTIKNSSQLVMATNQTGTATQPVGTQNILNNAIGGAEKRMYLMGAYTNGATNTSIIYHYNLISGTLTETDHLDTKYNISIPATFAGGIVGVTTNSNATAGNVGEYVSSLVAIGSPVSLSNGTAANITSISLTAGDWDVDGTVSFLETTSTVTARSAGVTSTTGTVPTDGSEAYCGVQSTVTSETNSIALTKKRFSLSGTTTIFLVGKASFSAGTCGAFGNLSARRVR